MANCCELLVSDPLFLKSGHGQVNVALNKSYPLFWQERTRSQVQLPPSEVWGLADRRQSLVCGSLRARSRDSGRGWGIQAPRTQLALSPQAARTAGAGPKNCDPGRQPLPFGHRDRERGEVHRLLKVWAGPAASLGEGSGALQDTDSSQPVPWAP